jgi:hypothetical protein
MNDIASMMKTLEEIEKRLDNLYDDYDDAVRRGDGYVLELKKAHIKALEWVLGSRKDF